MTERRPGPGRPKSLRERAEEALSPLPAPVRRESGDVVHELQVHQTELEMQNLELLRTQRELEASRYRFVTLFDLAPLPYFVFDVEHRLVDVNLAAAELLGADRSRLRGQPFFTHVMSDYRSLFHAHLNGVFAGTGNRTVELGLRDNGPYVRWIRLHSQIAPHIEENGARMCLSAGVDLTAQRQTEQALTDTHRMAADLVHHLPVALFIYRFEPPERLTLINANPEAERLTGVHPADWRGRAFGETWPTNLVSECRPAYLDVMKTGVTFETEAESESGGRIEAAFRVRAFRLPDQRLAVSFENMTEYRRAEAQLRASLDEKVVLFKEVHHRVKNNLQLVVSLLSLQAGRGLNADTASALRDARERVRSMALLHEGLYRTPNLANIDFAAYVQGLCSHIRASFAGVGAERVRISTRVERVGLAMEQAVPCGLIINELVTNALKHAFPEAASGSITVELSSVESRRVRLCVADDGVGMPHGYRHLEASTLGLQLVGNLARQLGGDLACVAGPKGGSVFAITFPRPPEAQP